MLMKGTYAFCRLAGDAVPKSAIGWFREAEGATVILPLEDANAESLAIDFEAAWIALGVESSLSAVGLTAAIAAALAAEGIACNVVAACRHDHLFVPMDRADDAMKVLARLGI
jgi:uncharacterized protein